MQKIEEKADQARERVHGLDHDHFFARPDERTHTEVHVSSMICSCPALSR
jgi:hypothetical protein